MLMAFLGQRRALVGELEELQGRRTEILGQLQRPSPGTSVPELQRLAADIDRRMADANVALRAVNQAIAGGGGSADVEVGGADVAISDAQEHFTLLPPHTPEPGSGFGGRELFFAGAGVVLVVALGLGVVAMLVKRMRRQTSESIAQLRSDLSEQMSKFSTGVESLAVEIERIGEGQRYVTKLLSESQAPAAQLLVKPKDAEAIRRP